MNNRSYCNPREQVPEIKWGRVRILLCAALCALGAPRLAQAGDAPAWMHAVATAPLPAHDEKTDAVLLYEERTVNVQSADKIKTQVRVVYKILQTERTRLRIRRRLPSTLTAKSMAFADGAFQPRARTMRSKTRKRSRSRFQKSKAAT